MYLHQPNTPHVSQGRFRAKIITAGARDPRTHAAVLLSASDRREIECRFRQVRLTTAGAVVV